MTAAVANGSVVAAGDNGGIRDYYSGKVEELELDLRDRTQNLRRLEAQRNELNAKVRLLREELQLLQEPGSYVGEVVKVMGKKKVLVKVHPEGKYVVDLDKSIDMAEVLPTTRVALRNDSYTVRRGTESMGRVGTIAVTSLCMPRINVALRENVNLIILRLTSFAFCPHVRHRGRVCCLQPRTAKLTPQKNSAAA